MGTSGGEGDWGNRVPGLRLELEPAMSWSVIRPTVTHILHPSSNASLFGPSYSFVCDHSGPFLSHLATDSAVLCRLYAIRNHLPRLARVGSVAPYSFCLDLGPLPQSRVTRFHSEVET